MNRTPMTVNSTPLCSPPSPEGCLPSHHPSGDVRRQCGRSKENPSLKELLHAASSVPASLLPLIQADISTIDARERRALFALFAQPGTSEEDRRLTRSRRTGRTSQARRLEAILEEALISCADDLP